MNAAEEIKRRLKRFTVGIAGCGGLGSNCAVALARVGIGKLVVADFDIVSASNLNRQHYFLDQVGEKKVKALQQNIFRLNPEVLVEPHDVQLDPNSIVKIFRACDVIVEAFDLAEMKHMLIETVLEEMPEKYVIAGIGLSGYGRNQDLATRRVGNLFICGDERSEASDRLPPLAPRVGIVSHMQANQVLEILLDEFPAAKEIQ